MYWVVECTQLARRKVAEVRAMTWRWGMQLPKCPVCNREVPWYTIRRDTFPCPLCQEPIRTPRPSRLWAIPPFVFGLPLGYAFSNLLGLQEDNQVVLVTFFVGLPAGLVVNFLIGLVRGILLLRGILFFELESNPGWDDGDILHITPQRGPSKRPL